MKKNLVCLVLLSLGVWQTAQAVDINPGTPINDETLPELAKSSLPYARLVNLHDEKVDDVHSLVAFTNMGSGDTYYGLFSNSYLTSINAATKQYLGGWELAAWPGVRLEPELEASPTLQDKTIGEVMQGAPLFQHPDAGMGAGCLLDRPLNYGDVDGDGQKELALFLGVDDLRGTQDAWVEFYLWSPTNKQPLFRSVAAREDSAPLADWQAEVDGLAEARRSQAPQYVSTVAAQDRIFNMRLAQRAYAKLYFGDFNADGKADILMWRKLYESRLASDALKGFALKGELLVQYSLADGVYKLQDTPSATVKAWLAAKDLTWQKGYPSMSECPGQEGKPIPELHDPLLNDLDVLK